MGSSSRREMSFLVRLFLPFETSIAGTVKLVPSNL
jgi:hypothetical protein